MLSLYEFPHRRKNPLTGTTVLVSPHRSKRPWHGKVDSVSKSEKKSYDLKCYLCPGNTRVSGHKNPHYRGTFVFTNDHRALLSEAPAVENSHPLLQQETVKGTCRVFCFSEDHSKTLGQLSAEQIAQVLLDLGIEIKTLATNHAWVQAFENKGQLMGCSNPHPHGQLWALDSVPQKVVTMDRLQKEYKETHSSNLLLDYVELELEQEQRIVTLNKDWLVVVPWWAAWPFETLLLPVFQYNSFLA